MCIRDSHWCGKWGHSASQCRDKDAYMEWVRNTGGYAKGGPTPKEAYGLQNNGPPSSGKVDANASAGESLLSSLETPSRTVFLGSLNKTTVKLQNRFDVLCQGDDELDDLECEEVTQGERPREATAKGRCGSSQREEVGDALQMYDEVRSQFGSSRSQFVSSSQ